MVSFSNIFSGQTSTIDDVEMIISCSQVLYNQIVSTHVGSLLVW